ncbi:alpha-mannosidase I MNS4 [Selaginella moellendorffii]|uniref:alpha-mannosidase I MNS4 n=1 Tax=Selaginella moellendorffii TaxID=88036 RepID=UPI000D1D05B7|nr:alpha-mannosidase I MNS4 [Selaginella moellendorffii]|eukprot:XP_002985136.2 alpha-mannosidase I MNS4 [Selaginella moellendorffii]
MPLLAMAAFLILISDGASAASVTAAEALQLRDEVKEMFYHAYNGYMAHAFPLDELRPMSCAGEDSLGGYALTLVDSLDMLAVLGDREKFFDAVNWIGKHLRFDKNKTVSVFETTIRVLGGLLSAHMLVSDQATGMVMYDYNDELLNLAEDLGRRLLPAFDTPTGIPYGSVNLLYGVSEDESQVTSTAGGGTLTMEFGVLSRLTGDPVFEEVSRNAVRGLWAQRSHIGLVGAHINVLSGEWTHKDSGIGTSIDSFYEYLLKAYLLFGEDEYLHMFKESYKAVMRYLFKDPWYMEVNMNSAVVVWPLFNSLQAFWPGLQVLAGDVEPATQTHTAFFSVWKKFGFTPEGFNLASMSIQPGQRSYPLRPELIESTYWLYKATRDPIYLDAGRDILASIQYGCRCPCGYCHIADVETHQQDDHMESFFLSETVKYLYLLFDLAAGGDNIVENGPYPYLFSTEGHLFPLTPQISLPKECCTYSGSFCPDSSKSNWMLHNATNHVDAGSPLKGACSQLSLWRRLAIANKFAKKTNKRKSARMSSILEAVEKAGNELVKVEIQTDVALEDDHSTQEDKGQEIAAEETKENGNLSSD